MFNNTYTATPVSHHIDGYKTLNGRILLNDEFTFVLEEVSYNGETIENPTSLTTKNFADGSFPFPAITYTNSGTYVYRVYEQTPDNTLAHAITYDTTNYYVTIVVKDNSTGNLYVDSETYTLTDASPVNTLSFLNKYTPSKTSAQFAGDKKLTGKVLGGNDFDFELYDSNANWAKGEKLETVQNASDGTFKFSSIDFTDDEDKYYIITEKNGGQTIDGVTYDSTVYRVYVDVTDDLKGQLHATVHIFDDEGIPQESILFVNEYVITGNDSVTLSGEKTLNGRDMTTDDVFTFELYETDQTFTVSSTSKETTNVNTQTGKYEFTLSYTQQDVGKTFYYVVMEKNAGQTIDGVTYSSQKYNVTVTVEDNGKGKLNIDETVILKVEDGKSDAVNTISFENSYNATPATVSLGGNKVLNGRELTAGEFKFLLYSANSNFEVAEGVTAILASNDANGSLVFDTLTVTEAKTYYFVIKEDTTVEAERITFDESVYNVSVEVKDDENGKLVASQPVIVKVGDTAVENIEFNNTYTPKPDDINVEFKVHKTVINQGTEVIGPEDFEFRLEDILSGGRDYQTVKSDANGEAAFNLTFSEDDIGKIFCYKLTEVNDGKENVQYSTAEYLITVEISLDANNNLVATLTQNDTVVGAVVAEFENVYDHTPTTTIPSEPETTTVPSE
ncbi:MAG: FctA domain-containing protein, partial [Acutalibacteraceae bacterium]|nr:FctA domain-containing protein [Acutalibacteraceae bacterium]